MRRYVFSFLATLALLPPATRAQTAPPVPPNAVAPAAPLMSVRPEPEKAPAAPAPDALPVPSAEARPADGSTVYLRLAPASFALAGRVLGDAQAPWFPDLLELGVGLGRLDVSVVLRSQSPFAAAGQHGASLPSVAAAYRPLRGPARSLVDVYFQGAFAAGGVGALVQAPGCNPANLGPNQECGLSHAGFGLGPSLGVGLELKVELGAVPGGQTAFLTLGLEARAHWVLSFLPDDLQSNLFGVFGLPLGLRFE
jgi:hypothetical protein